MKPTILDRFLIVFFTSLLLLPNTSPVAAEGETPQIALSVYQASPGATIEITGGRFEPDIQVTLLLLQNGTQIPLGTVLCDDHGEFTVPVLLPLNLQVGQYEFQAVDEKNRMAAAPLAIIADENGGEDLRQDEDGLLQPMPTLMPVVATPLAQTNDSQNAPNSNSMPSIVWIALILTGLLIAAIIRVVKA